MNKLKFEAVVSSDGFCSVTDTDYEYLTELEARIIAAICNEVQEPGGPGFDVIESHWAWRLMLRIEALEAKLAK